MVLERGVGVWFASNGMAFGGGMGYAMDEAGLFLHGFGALMIHLSIMVCSLQMLRDSHTMLVSLRLIVLK